MSSDRPDWVSALEAALGTAFEALAPAPGGDIAESVCARCRGGERVFLKRYPAAASGSIALAEASGLEWLRAAEAIRVPRVLAAIPEALALEWIATDPYAPRTPVMAERLGQSLAALHRAGAPAFGLNQDGFIGRLPQPNDPAPEWAPFYRDARIAPLAERARRAGRLGREEERLLASFLAAIPDLVGPPEPPARLHGDLWSGNCLFDENGEAWIFDPAAYGGHREVDLAMMRLFGGFEARTFEAYEEAFPLAAGAQERVPVYQTYPLLVHVCLFGTGYRASLRAALRDALENLA